MSFSEKFMKLPQKLRMVIVGIVLFVLAVPVIGLLIFLKQVLPEGKASAASPATTSTAAPKSPAKAAPKATTAKKK
jgi:hypothetical protein